MSNKVGEEIIIRRDIKKQRGFELVDEKFKKGNYPSSLPVRSTSRSAGYDFFSTKTITIQPKEQVKFQLNVKAYMQKDEVLNIHIRSSLGFKYGLILSNSTGIIDSDYYNNEATGGNIGVAITNLGDKPYTIEGGEKVCQGIFSQYLITDDDSPLSNVRTGGIGSTGK
jgi:dUTP pyrophosphatase